MSLRAPLLYLLAGGISGLLLSRLIDLPPVISSGTAGILALACLAVARGENPKQRVWYLLFIASSTVLALGYGELRLPPPADDEALSLPEREARLTLKIERTLGRTSQFGKTAAIATVKKDAPLARLSAGHRVFLRLGRPAWYPLEGSLRGAVVEATGILRPIQEQLPLDNSFDAFLKEQGIDYRFERTSGITIVRPPSAFMRFCQRSNAHFRDTLLLGAPDGLSASGIYPAMLLGSKQDLSPSQRDQFRWSGTMHLFAISGLHIGVIAGVIAQSLIVLRVPRPIAPFIGLPMVFLYVMITGAAPSAVRAFLMAAFYWLSVAVVRQRSPLPALVASAIAVLIVDPRQLWSIGFQLSYAVVLSILLFGLPFHRAVTEHLHPYRYLPEASWTIRQRALAGAFDALSLLFAISLSAWLVSTPLSAGLFGFVVPGAVFLNVLLVNLASLVIAGGVLSIGLSLVTFSAASAFLNNTAWLVLTVMETLVQGFVALPASHLPSESFPRPLAYATVLTYFGFLFYAHGQQSPTRRSPLFLAIAAIITLAPVSAMLFLFP